MTSAELGADAAPGGETRRSWRLRPLRGAARAAFPWNLFWDQRQVLRTLVQAQIARRHRRSILGWGWNLIQPGSQAALLFLATRAAIQVPESSSPLGGFGVFFAAYIIGQGTGEIIGRAPSLVAERAAWVKGSLFPLELLAPTAVGVALYRIVPGGLLGIGAVVISSGPLAGLETLAAFLVGLSLAVVWGTTLALALSAVGVYLRDAILAAPILTIAAIFISPLYIPDDTGFVVTALKNLNPLTIPMNLVLHGLAWIPDHLVHFSIGLAAALAALWAAALGFRRLSPTFADHI